MEADLLVHSIHRTTPIPFSRDAFGTRGCAATVLPSPDVSGSSAISGISIRGISAPILRVIDDWANYSLSFAAEQHGIKLTVAQSSQLARAWEAGLHSRRAYGQGVEIDGGNRSAPIDLYQIHRAWRSDRLPALRDAMAASCGSLHWRLWTAVEGGALPLPSSLAARPLLEAGMHRCRQPRGVLGCFLSHAGAWRALLASGRPHAIVLEDDWRPLPPLQRAAARCVAQLNIAPPRRGHRCSFARVVAGTLSGCAWRLRAREGGTCCT
jgi:hypothetical protein